MKLNNYIKNVIERGGGGGGGLVRSVLIKTSFGFKIYLGFALFAMAVLASRSFILTADYKEIERNSTQKVSAIAYDLENVISDRVQLVKLSINIFVELLENKLITPDVIFRSRNFMDGIFKDAPFISSLRVLDASGTAIVANDLDQVTKINYRDRPYFQYHQTYDDDQILISKPLIGRTLLKPRVIFSKRFNLAEGTFGGVVMVAVEVESFHNLLATVDYGQHGFGLLRYQDDLSFLTRYPLDAAKFQGEPDKVLASSELRIHRDAGLDLSTAQLKPAADGHDRINAFKKIRGTPFVLEVSASETDYAAFWKERAFVILSFSFALILLGWLVTKWLIRSMSLVQLHEKRVRALFETSSAGIVRSNKSGQFIEFNRAFADLCGYSEEELKKLTSRDLTPKDFIPEERRQIDVMKNTHRYGPYRKQFIRKDGRLIDVELNGSVVWDANGEMYVWSIVNDISQALQDQQILISAKRTAEDADLAKTQFLGTMSHELRTPLNGIEGTAQLLKRAEFSDSDRIEAAEIIIKSSRQLKVLLNDLLDASQLAANKLELRPDECDVESLVNELISLFTPAAQQKSLKIQVELNAPAGHYRLDAIRLRQMLTNLISNALKFTGAGFIRIQVNEIVRVEDAAVLEFAVHDSGVGIAQDKLDLLFKRFSRVEIENMPATHGAGLGLSIVQGLAKRMGGSAGVESSQGNGSRFWFQIQVVVAKDWNVKPIPTGQLDSLPPQMDSPVTTDFKDDAANVALKSDVVALVVEDNPINQKVVARFLSEIDLPTLCVGNGLEGLNAIKQGIRPQFILMDVQMPVMNGLQATEAIRQWEAAQGLPRTVIIGLTAGVVESDKYKCLDSGMDEVLFKPVDLDELESKIYKLTGLVQRVSD